MKTHRILEIVVLVPLQFIVFCPVHAHAYADPGVVGLLFQAIFTFVFGFLFVWIAKPFKYISSTAGKIKERFRSRRDNN